MMRRMVCTPTMLVALLLACASLVGCASAPLGQHQPSIERVQQLRSSPIPSIAVGEFAAHPQLRAADKAVSARGSQFRAPNGSFAQYLRDALIAELSSAGKYDPTATTTIGGQLTENVLNAGGVSTADATLAANFVVKRAGSVVFEKDIREHHEWPSSFVGAVALPAAFNEYTAMYSRILTALFGDPQFLRAIADTE